MLVLSRKIGEKISIYVPVSTEPRTIELVVVELRGDKVRLGLSAEKDIVILRDDVVKGSHHDNATKSSPQEISEGRTPKTNSRVVGDIEEPTL